MEWELDRPDRTFRVHVVEPEGSKPDTHDDIFMKAIIALISPPSETAVDAIPGTNEPKVSWFDLLTFPEAFLASDAFIKAVKDIHDYGVGSLGCVHVGLRPPRSTSTHLFHKAAMRELVDQLRAIEHVETTDLDFFAGWVGQQADDRYFNIACMFAVADGKTRICLHPKNLRSKFEIDPLPEKLMSEGNIVTAVTVKSPGRKTVTIQPVICADALDMKGDYGWKGPLDTIDDMPLSPDEVDVVSVSTCSPQSRKDGYPTWHSEFKNSFLQGGKSRNRHNFSIFALANFGAFKGKSAGLSGLYFPRRSRHAYPDYLVTYQYGTDELGEENRWSTPNDDMAAWSGRASILSIAPDKKLDGDIATMVGFTLTRLPRDMDLNASDMIASACRLHVARVDDANQIIFEGNR
jgi:hypothetical protein